MQNLLRCTDSLTSTLDFSTTIIGINTAGSEGKKSQQVNFQGKLHSGLSFKKLPEQNLRFDFYR